MTLIDPIKVHAAFTDCLFKEKEITEQHVPPEGAVIVQGIIHQVGMHPDRLESHRDEVKGWLKSLPNEFQKSGGGGWSFLNACVDKEGEQWGEHDDMDHLFILGMGLKLVESQLPREMWDSLPGGMPYYIVVDD